jgi:Ni/Fe-hydrogenase subunit HybB-like protein
MEHGMEHAFHIVPFTGYVYPNETVFPWTVLIVVYPYLTGLVAGAFTVSSFYHVFGIQMFRPVSRLALQTALAFMIFVPFPLLMHLGHPERAFNAMITPHLTSAFVAFGYFALFYVCLLVLEIWFMFRADIVAHAAGATGVVKQFYRALSLWSDDVSERARRIDHKIMFTLAVIGIPAAHGLHGYVGFVFASVKSREWWSSDLMPAIFLFSAIISGVALLIVLYVIVCKLRRIPIDEDCVRGLAFALWGFMMFTLLLEGVEFATLVYKGREGIDHIMEYVAHHLYLRFFVLQFAIGAVLPIIMLTFMVFLKVRGKTFIWVAFVSGALVLMSVYMMRWNVVIGGQEISKTLRGLLEYDVPVLGREGLLVSLTALLGPLVLLYIFTRVLPPWRDRSPEAGES